MARLSCQNSQRWRIHHYGLSTHVRSLWVFISVTVFQHLTEALRENPLRVLKLDNQIVVYHVLLSVFSAMVITMRDG